jgi:hypothetical protein
VALTNADATKLAQNIVTDVNANVAVEAPAPRKISHEAAILFDKTIIAKPLGVPQVCDVHIKNTEYAYRWVNRDGQGGRMYTQRRAQGFLNATEEDAQILGGDVATKDGEIRAGDLILMKIRHDLYDAAIKSNMVKANLLANARGLYLEGASSDVNSNAVPNRKTVSAEPGATTKMAVPFIPSNADAMINDSIQSGRAEETRHVVDELRAKPAKE